MFKKIKDKLYYYFARKNWGVRREYEPYVDAHREEHEKEPWKHWWILIKLNWHYRVLRSKEYMLPPPKKAPAPPPKKPAAAPPPKPAPEPQRYASEINRRYLAQFKNKFEGETVVICGGGSSLAGYEPIPGAKHIALNRTVFYDKVKFDMLFMQDHPILDTEHTLADYNAYPCDKFYGIIRKRELTFMGINESELKNVSGNLFRYEIAPKSLNLDVDNFEFDLASYCMADACSVFFSALQFAVYAGFKKIYLVGIDFSNTNYDGKENKSYYAQNVVNYLLLFKRQLRVYDESVDLTVIRTTNIKIYKALGKAENLITVVGISSETYRKCLDLQKLSCQDSYRYDYSYFTDEEFARITNSFSKDNFYGFLSGNTVRVKYTIQCIKKYWGELLLLTDADLVFLRETEDELIRELGDNDLIFLQERIDKNNPYERAQLNINLGCVFMRCNENTLKFWEELCSRTENNKGWDQEEANLMLIENKDFVKWDYMSDLFPNGWAVTEKNIHEQYICTGCGSVAKHFKLSKFDYLSQIVEMARGKRTK